MALAKYRFRLAWQGYRVGDVIEPTGLLRDWLRSSGYIEPVIVEPTGNPSAVFLPGPEQKPKKRGRPRKADGNGA